MSLIRRGVLPQAQTIVQTVAAKPLRLVTASGDELPVSDHVRAPVQLGELKFMDDFVVVKSLVTPVILGVDFLLKNALVLDFAETPAVIHSACVHPPLPAEECLARDQVHSLYKDTHKTGRGGYTSAVIEQPGTDVIDECAIPRNTKTCSKLHQVLQRQPITLFQPLEIPLGYHHGVSQPITAKKLKNKFKQCWNRAL